MQQSQCGPKVQYLGFFGSQWQPETAIVACLKTNDNEESLNKEVTMNKQIDSAAGLAMAEWESFFSEELLVNAKAIATSAKAEVITVEHLREAAGRTVETLLTKINGEQGTDGQRKAA